MQKHTRIRNNAETGLTNKRGWANRLLVKREKTFRECEDVRELTV